LIAVLIVASISAPPVELGWRAPAECPDVAHARGAIDRLLAGHAPADDRRVTADVVIERGGRGFRARVRVDDGASVGERELDSASCEEVADAAALIVAMAVDPRLAGEAVDEGDPEAVAPIPAPPPDASEQGVAATDDRTSTSTSTSTSTNAPAVVAAQRPPQRGSLKFIGRAAGGVGYGSVPTVSGVVMIAFALAGARWRVELDVDVWTPRTRRPPANSAIGVRVLGWTLGVRGCGSPLARRLEIPLCAGVRAGALHGSGVGRLQSSRELAPWVSATFGAGLWGWITPRFALALDVDGLVSITTPAFDTQPAGFVVRAPPGGVRALFGPVVRLP
jgi:hypothetical protein